MLKKRRTLRKVRFKRAQCIAALTFVLSESHAAHVPEKRDEPHAIDHLDVFLSQNSEALCKLQASPAPVPEKHRSVVAGFQFFHAGSRVQNISRSSLDRRVNSWIALFEQSLIYMLCEVGLSWFFIFVFNFSLFFLER